VRRGLEDPAEDPLIADARAHGASAASLEKLRAHIERQRGLAGECVVWAAHWHAFAVFKAMATQWRVEQGRAGLLYTGLDYGGLAPVLDEHRRRLPRRLRQPPQRLMPQLRTLEHAARTALKDHRG
jgi:hypothetical protein